MDFPETLLPLMSSKECLADFSKLDRDYTEINIEVGYLGEDFLFADLSEFCNEDIGAPIGKPEISDDPSKLSSMNSYETSASVDDVSGDISRSDSMKNKQHIITDACLPPPCLDETGLEWLSTFGEDTLIYGASNLGIDSFLLKNADAMYSKGLNAAHDEHSILGCKNTGPVKSEAASCGTDASWGKESANSMAPTPVPGRARSKRHHSSTPAAWSWGFLASSSPTNSLDSTSALSYMTTSSMCPSELRSLSTNAPGTDDEYDYNMGSPSKLQSSDEGGSGNSTKSSKLSHKRKKGHDNRRCLHCFSQKTPQWRAGPTGPKTLCNACGVRYKSGRLFPEYRPAKSPTFLSSKHSSSHKKVLEMRRRKAYTETQALRHGQLQQLHNQAMPELKLSAMAQSNAPDFKFEAQPHTAASTDLNFYY